MLKDGSCKLPHHPDVVKARDNVSEAIAELKAGSLKTAAHLGRRTPVHTAAIPLEVADEDEDTYRLRKPKETPKIDKPADKALKFSEAHFKAILPLVSHAMWGIDAVVSAIGTPSSSSESDMRSVLDEVSSSLRKIADVSSTAVGSTIVSRRRLHLQEAELPSEVQQKLVRLPWNEKELFGGKLEESFTKYLAVLNFDQAVKRLHSDRQSGRKRQYASKRVAKIQEPRQRQPFRRQDKKRPTRSATVTRPADKDKK